MTSNVQVEATPTKIELKGTSDTSDEQSGNAAVDQKEPAVAQRELSTKQQNKLMIAGIAGIVVLVIVVGVVVALVTTSLHKSSSNQSSTGEFDFSEVDPDFTAITSSPTLSPTNSPTNSPTTQEPSEPPTSGPSTTPTLRPSLRPTSGPSSTPSISIQPTPSPTNGPTMRPTGETPAPTMRPNTAAPITPVDYDSDSLLVFCSIADVPYTEEEALELPNQIANQLEGCEFLVHLGDIMKGEVGCDEFRYSTLKDTLMESDIPVFIVPGDNEWNDCGDNTAIDSAWVLWEQYLMNFDNNFNHTFSVVHDQEYPEIFYFVQKRTLIFGLNIVGGRIHDSDEWHARHTYQAEWVKSIISMNVPNYADGVIIMAHAKETDDHSDFFNPIKSFLKNDLNNEVPLFYFHGDGHAWKYTPHYFDQPNFLRIQHEGGVRDPVLKILADPHALGPNVQSAFQYDRQLELEQ
eukprot:Nitzschia sp. Nitz4//scaffold29_size155292//3814//5288//NITZ4_002631-RA/size155292-augustus-gene-0.217-mRNA-1//-1//CDS//3329546367//5860//frame0